MRVSVEHLAYFDIGVAGRFRVGPHEGLETGKDFLPDHVAFIPGSRLGRKWTCLGENYHLGSRHTNKGKPNA